MGFLPVSLAALVGTSMPTANDAMKSFVSPVVNAMCIFATLACTFFIVYGAFQYMTSSGQPDRLQDAKKTIRNH